jgi:hypothetical protein
MPPFSLLLAVRSAPRNLRWLAAIALAMGLAASLISSSAEASCGDYVKRLGPGFVPGKAAAEQVAAESHTSMPASCPCHGPECRRSPRDQAPLPPSTPTRTTSSQELTTIAHRSLTLTLGSCWFVGEFSGRTSRGYPLGTNRPPSA